MQAAAPSAHPRGEQPERLDTKVFIIAEFQGMVRRYAGGNSRAARQFMVQQDNLW